MLPGVDGLSLLRRIRAAGDTPVILLTARTEEIDRVVGLELGADDYVVKPFSPRELAVRVRNMLRRTAASTALAAPGAGQQLHFGDRDAGTLDIDTAAREAAVDGPRGTADAEGVRPARRARRLAAPGVLPPAAARAGVGLGARVPGPGDRHGAHRPAAPEAARPIPSIRAGSSRRGASATGSSREPSACVGTRSAIGPLATVVAVVVLAACAVGAGLALRAADLADARRCATSCSPSRSSSLAIGAVVAVVLARLMVLDADQARSALGVLAATAVLATVLAAVGVVGPLGRDAQRLESAVRRLEAGDRSRAHRCASARDELGHVARALDELTERLDVLERERAGFEEERRRMLSSVGHDLRTPLSALRAAVEALTDGVAPDPERYLRSMRRDVEALGALVDDLFLRRPHRVRAPRAATASRSTSPSSPTRRSRR